MSAFSTMPEQEQKDAAWAAFRSKACEQNAIALIQQHIPLVRRVVQQMAIYQSSYIDMEDLMQHALMGLWTAIGRYDEARGVPFEAFALPRIRGAVHDALRQQDPLTRTEREVLKKLNQYTREHMEEFNEVPDEDTLAEVAGIPSAQMRELLARSQPWISLDAQMDDGPDSFGSLGDRLADERAPDPRDETSRRERIAQFREVFKRLPVRQQKILYLYYFEDLTLKEVGAVMDLSEARICQLHAAALLVLKAMLTTAPMHAPGTGGEEGS